MYLCLVKWNISESCDDCRVEDSRKVQKFVLSDRDKQLDERKRIEEEEVCLCVIAQHIYNTFQAITHMFVYICFIYLFNCPFRNALKSGWRSSGTKTA